MEEQMKMAVAQEATPCEGTCGCKQDEQAKYAQLSNIANQLYVQNQELGKRLNELEMSNFFKRLDWLWNIINSTSPYITEAFKKTCGQEFMDMMSKPEEDPKETENTDTAE